MRAAHVACVLARQEQDMGNYKLAYEQVHHAYCELRSELTKLRLQSEDTRGPDAPGARTALARGLRTRTQTSPTRGGSPREAPSQRQTWDRREAFP